jgi:hypothetical protein
MKRVWGRDDRGEREKKKRSQRARHWEAFIGCVYVKIWALGASGCSPGEEERLWQVAKLSGTGRKTDMITLICISHIELGAEVCFAMNLN